MTRRLLASGIAILVLLGIGFIGFRYTSAISEKNRLEQKRIDLEFKKLEQEKEQNKLAEAAAQAARKQEENEEAIRQKDAEKLAAVKASFFTECQKIRKQNWDDMVDFLNTCTRYGNTIEHCQSSDAMKILGPISIESYVVKCVNDKTKLYLQAVK